MQTARAAIATLLSIAVLATAAVASAQAPSPPAPSDTPVTSPPTRGPAIPADLPGRDPGLRGHADAGRAADRRADPRHGERPRPSLRHRDGRRRRPHRHDRLRQRGRALLRPRPRRRGLRARRRDDHPVRGRRTERRRCRVHRHRRLRSERSSRWTSRSTGGRIVDGAASRPWAAVPGPDLAWSPSGNPAVRRRRSPASEARAPPSRHRPPIRDQERGHRGPDPAAADRRHGGHPEDAQHAVAQAGLARRDHLAVEQAPYTRWVGPGRSRRAGTGGSRPRRRRRRRRRSPRPRRGSPGRRRAPLRALRARAACAARPLPASSPGRCRWSRHPLPSTTSRTWGCRSGAPPSRSRGRAGTAHGRGRSPRRRRARGRPPASR